jgi:hypothetical protein
VVSGRSCGTAGRKPIGVRCSKDHSDIHLRLRYAEDGKDEDQIFAARWQHGAAGLISGVFGGSELPEREHRPLLFFI